VSSDSADALEILIASAASAEITVKDDDGCAAAPNVPAASRLIGRRRCGGWNALMFAADKGAVKLLKHECFKKKRSAGHEGGKESGRTRLAAARRRRGYDDGDLIRRGNNAPLNRLSFKHIVGRIVCIVDKTVREALSTEIRTVDGLERRYTRRELHRDLESGYIRTESMVEECEAGTGRSPCTVDSCLETPDSELIPTDGTSSY
jgi:hypothetical protein